MTQITDCVSLSEGCAIYSELQSASTGFSNEFHADIRIDSVNQHQLVHKTPANPRLRVEVLGFMFYGLRLGFKV